jgi:hypothetical protein
MVRNLNPVERLISQLLSETPEADRCPNFRADGLDVYCGRDLNQGESPGEIRRMLCDTACLQLWCLDKKI